MGFAFIAVTIAAFVAAAPIQAATSSGKAKPRQLQFDNKPWKGDFDRMLERRQLRMLIPYSRSLFFVDKGYERGIAAESARELEQYLNKKYAKRLGNRPLTVYLVPTTRDRLLTGVAEGFGDIAEGNITVTEERRKLVDFVAPEQQQPMRELIVTGPASPALATLEDLSGRTIHVRPATSYYESVLKLNDRLQKAGKAPVQIAPLPDALEDEDKLEMLSVGAFEYVIVDDWKARIWAQVLPKIKVREDLVLRDGALVGAAIRKHSPQLTRMLEDFHTNHLRKKGGREARIAKYHKRIRQIHNNTAGEDWKRFEATYKLFEKYGAKYSFDPLMLAAQGFQESRLRQDARSRVGAVGVMQLMPATGAELGVGDITRLEPNIHGGAKYLDQLMTRYFPDARFAEQERTLFAFASYNCGPGNVARMRKLAVQRGLDPDLWFNNVEIVVGEKIGTETTSYVRNIFKYYVAYKLATHAEENVRRVREQVRPAKR